MLSLSVVPEIKVILSVIFLGKLFNASFVPILNPYILAKDFL